ncbi:MAG: GTP 3',8-cyclase MoaA [Rhodobacteraceae bacterium]|nr:GTP 3',8-cyclase MoaA [Paracoccaceae bacterium]
MLTDQFNRKINYIRVSVTDRCDFRCVYCMSEKMKFIPKDDLLSLEEIARIIRIFNELGIEKVRITGGEPLVRKNIDWLFKTIHKENNFKEITLTTNGSQLKQKALMLKDSGVERINISLDSLDPKIFNLMTRVGKLNDVLEGIEHAKKIGFKKIKLNVVLMKNLNGHEIFNLVDFAIASDFDIAFIEEMPLGNTKFDRSQTSISNDNILNSLQTKYSLLKSDLNTGGPSKYWKITNSNTKIGLISPHSHNFCEDCNRVRISCKGELFLCLGHEDKVELLPLIKSHPFDDGPIIEAIINSMKFKPESHTFNLLDKQPSVIRFMSHTGG